MRNNRPLKYALSFCGIYAGIIALQLLFPTILNSRLLFGGLVALLFIGGVATTVIAIREMGRRQ